jgi:hypothetical protein
VNVLEEGNQRHELLVVGIALPGLQNDGVLGLLADVFGLGVEDDDLGEITVEVGEVLVKD